MAVLQSGMIASRNKDGSWSLSPESERAEIEAREEHVRIQSDRLRDQVRGERHGLYERLSFPILKVKEPSPSLYGYTKSRVKRKHRPSDPSLFSACRAISKSSFKPEVDQVSRKVYGTTRGRWV